MDLKFEVKISSYTKEDFLRILGSWGYPKSYKIYIVLFILFWIIIGFLVYLNILLNQKITTFTGFMIVAGLLHNIYIFKRAEIHYFVLAKILPKLIKKKKETSPNEIQICFYENESVIQGETKVENSYNTLLRCEISSKDFLLRFKKTCLLIKKEDFILGTPEEFLEFISTKTIVVTPKTRYGAY